MKIKFTMDKIEKDPEKRDYIGLISVPSNQEKLEGVLKKINEFNSCPQNILKNVLNNSYQSRVDRTAPKYIPSRQMEHTVAEIKDLVLQTKEKLALQQ